MKSSASGNGSVTADSSPAIPVDAVLIFSFGGPNGMDDVIPFLENVLRGKRVPRERLLEVAHHYELFGGKSPINEQNEELRSRLVERMQGQEPNLPVYVGNRNWHPYLVDTLRHMQADGVRRAVAFVTSAYSSYSGCRQYREDIERARAQLGAGAPQIDKIRVFFNHPLFIQVNQLHVQTALDAFPDEVRPTVPVVYTAHSIPIAMAQKCAYEQQLCEAARLVSTGVGHTKWQVAWQSRSGPPQQPWLEPDICDVIREIAASGGRNLVISPLGFTSDHMEVLFDLDTEARELCDALGVQMVRAAAAGNHPFYIEMIHELIRERVDPGHPQRRTLGSIPPAPDQCPVDCCLP